MIYKRNVSSKSTVFIMVLFISPFFFQDFESRAKESLHYYKWLVYARLKIDVIKIYNKNKRERKILHA